MANKTHNFHKRAMPIQNFGYLIHTVSILRENHYSSLNPICNKFELNVQLMNYGPISRDPNKIIINL